MNEEELNTPLPWQSDYAGNTITDCVPSHGYTFSKVIARFINWKDVPFVLERVNNYDRLKAALQAKDAEIAELKKQAADELEHKNYISNLLFLVDDELKRLKKSVEAGQMIDGRALWKARYEAERSRSEKLAVALKLSLDYINDNSDADDDEGTAPIYVCGNKALAAHRKPEEAGK